MKKTFSMLLRISITFVLLIFLFHKTDFGALFAVLVGCDFRFMFTAFAIFLFLNVLGLLRWYILLSGLDIHVNIGRLCLSFLASQFFNLVLPSTVGGDALRTLDISTHTGKHSSGVLATVVVDRLTGFFGMMTILIGALIFGFHIFRDNSIIWATLLLLLLISFLTGVMFSGRFFHFIMKAVPFKKVKEYLNKLHATTHSYRKCPGVLALAWLISFIIQAGMCVIYYFVALSIGLKLPLVYFWIFIPMITTFAVIPLSIGGLGLRDTACVAVFAKIGVVAEKALMLSLTNFGFMIIVGLVGGVSYVFALHRRRV